MSYRFVGCGVTVVRYLASWRMIFCDPDDSGVKRVAAHTVCREQVQGVVVRRLPYYFMHPDVPRLVSFDAQDQPEPHLPFVQAAGRLHVLYRSDAKFRARCVGLVHSLWLIEGRDRP